MNNRIEIEEKAPTEPFVVKVYCGGAGGSYVAGKVKSLLHAQVVYQHAVAVAKQNSVVDGRRRCVKIELELCGTDILVIG